MENQDNKKNEETARKNLLRASNPIEGTTVKGHDFNKSNNYQDIINSFKTTGHQASEFSKAIEITNAMIQEKATIFLGYTSNLVSSGLRDIFRYLVEKKKVHVLVTTAGGIEEDIIKCLHPFYLGDFKAHGKELREKGINRIGNIFVPNDAYIKFEQFFQPIIEELYQDQLKTKAPINPSDIIWKLGEKINNPESICYHAYKNQTRIYCPALTDGAIGDNIYFFKFKHPDFQVDIAEDCKRLNDTTLGLAKSGLIILGSGVVKHSILNANMLRNGADYAV